LTGARVRMQTATRVAIEALLCQTHADTHRVTESSRAVESASLAQAAPASWSHLEPGRKGGSSWSARLGKHTLSAYRRGGLPGRPPRRREPLDRPRTFFRQVQGEPRTTRPRPPSAPSGSALPFALSATEGRPANAGDRPASAACRSHRAHSRSVYAHRPQRPTSARVISSDDSPAGAQAYLLRAALPQ
jgi:hypothetical protein